MNTKLAFQCAVATANLILQSATNALSPPQPSAFLGQAHSTEGLLYYQLGLWPQAMARYKQSLAVFQAEDNLIGIGHVCRQIGAIMLHWQDYSLARRWAELAAYTFTKALRAEGHQPMVRSDYAAALHLLGQANFHQGHFFLALKRFEKALALRNQLHDDVGEALVLVDMGRVYHAQRQYWFALACYEGALDIGRLHETALEGRWFEAEIRHLIAQVCRVCGHQDLALKHDLEALALGNEESAK
ncbi:tetratricopeptide repeat protein [Nodosilinea nodulosa]|uniref:tetratricopeptide repeat protein n=1 Tax=Nodosilinea nodulosa TaxID=416001 RepID=UPI000380B5F0|nr:tetratricopeptide repeat protein [Nodosilinea nodulosa]